MVDPGLTLTDQQPATTVANVIVDGQPPSACWHALARTDGFQELLIYTLRETLSERTAAEAYHLLDEAGITALDGTYADLCLRVARGDQSALWTLLRATADFGQPQNRRTELSIGIDAPLQALRHGPLAVLGLADTPATVTVRITQKFERQRADQRRTLCQLLTALAQVCDVRIIAGRITRRYLATTHRADLPGVSDYRIDSPQQSRLETLVERAAVDLDPEGRPVAILRAVADEPAETLSYHALAAGAHVSRARIRQCLMELREDTLIATFDSPDGMAVELLPAGRALIERFDTEVGRQRTLPELCDRSVSDSSNSSNHGRVDPAPTSGFTQSEGDRTTFERSHGRVGIRSLSRSEYAAAVGAARHEGIGLVDHPIHYNRVNGVKEGRQGMRYYDAEAARLVVAAEYYNPLQYWVAIARALANERTFRHILMDATLDDVFDESLTVLRDCRNVGYLPDRAATPSGYREELEAARDDLLELTHDLKLAEREGDDERYHTLRSTVLRVAHGLVGTILHLLDLADIEVVRELRLPEFARKHLSDDDFRSDLTRTVAVGAAIQSSYGQFVAYRQLFEQRPRKRRSAITPTVDAADPFGRLIGSFAIVGPRVTDLEADLRAAIRNLGDVHEDAPAFAIRVPIEDRTHARAAFVQATRTMCLTKNLTPTRQAISLLRALTGTPYDAATALYGLAPESEPLSPGRDIRPDELRYALSTLHPGRLLPVLPPTVGRLVHTLLGAQIPLTQTALAERADVCTQSIRNHRDALEALGLVSSVDGGLRFALPFRAERGESEGSTLPWYAVGSPDRDQHLLLVDVLFEVVERVIDDPARLSDPDDSIGGVFFTIHSRFEPTKLVVPTALPWLRPWIDVLEALLDRESVSGSRLREQHGGTRAVVLGEVPAQLDVVNFLGEIDCSDCIE